MKNILWLTVFLFASSFVNSANADEQSDKFRAYISTRLAKAVLSNDVVTPDEVEEQCDGSGWITHGDGHRTECPGCSACLNDSEPLAAAEETHEYNLYHFGAEWCGPCQQMKSETWSSDEMKKYLEDKNTKLYILDSDNDDHKKFFSYYQISSYPTVILLKSDELERVLLRTTGFKNTNSMKTLLDGKYDE